MTTLKMPDRRAAVKGLAMAALMASPTAAAASSVDRAAWDAAVSAYERAQAAYLDAEDTYSTARDAYAKARPVKPPVSFVHYDHEPRAEFERKAANQTANLNAWKAADAACRAEHRVDELDAALNRASAAISQAFDGVLVTPAPDIGAVVQKLEAALDQDIELDDFEPILADLRRLGGLAA